MFCNAAFGAKRLNIVRYVMNAEVGASMFVTDKDYFDNVGITMPTIGAENKTYGNSDKWLENADYFRCENISIGYTFPRSVLKFADLRLTLSCQNLFTITSYKGMDPAELHSATRTSTTTMVLIWVFILTHVLSPLVFV